MNRDHYQEWLAEKRQMQAPADFADLVMAASTTELPAWKTAAFLAKAAILTLAVFGGIARYAITVFFVFFS